MFNHTKHSNVKPTLFCIELACILKYLSVKLKNRYLIVLYQLKIKAILNIDDVACICIKRKLL